ncbi:hypothetical protein [Ponticoccus litoralis]|uniref:NADH-quinone oxidoreductase subunit E n=1 Tax=Ponticoccus litoralis TaxID=422297 RepID=A0AAW9STF3_9RHOB
MTMKTPYFTMTPDYSPVVRMMAMQTVFAVETTQKMLELAMLPWKGMPTPYGLMRAGLCVSNPTAVKAMPEAPSTVDEVVKEARRVAERAEAVIEAAAEKTEADAEKAEAVTKLAAPAPEPQAKAAVTAPAAEAKPVETKPAASVKPAAAPVKPAATPAAPAAKPAAAKAEPAAPAQAQAAKAPATPVAAAKATETPVAAFVEPVKLAAPKGEADDLTALNGVGPKLAEALNAQGIWHYSQIAAWTESNVAWVDENLPGVRGRASRNGWVAQAAALAK